MAYIEIKRHGVQDLPQEYSGVSTDVKPTAVNGSTFFEEDTGDTYFYGSTGWVVI